LDVSDFLQLYCGVIFMLGPEVIPLLALAFSTYMRREIEMLKKDLGMKSWFRDGGS